MSYKGYYTLKEVISGFSSDIIDKVISSEDKNVKKDYYTEIQELCSLNKIDFFNRNDKYIISTEFIILISWRWIVTTESRLIVLHDSLLPKYRGFNPLVSCLLNREKEIGVTAILAGDEYDSGDIINQKKINIDYPIRIFDAIKTISVLYYEIIHELILKLANNTPVYGCSQNETEASYSLWRDDEDYRIHWERSSEEIRRHIDALSFPYEGASSLMGKVKVRILEAKEFPDCKIEIREPGKVIFIKEGAPVVVCGNGLLMITSIIEDATGNSILPLDKFRIRFS